MRQSEQARGGSIIEQAMEHVRTYGGDTTGNEQWHGASGPTRGHVDLTGCESQSHKPRPTGTCQDNNAHDSPLTGTQHARGWGLVTAGRAP